MPSEICLAASIPFENSRIKSNILNIIYFSMFSEKDLFILEKPTENVLSSSFLSAESWSPFFEFRSPCDKDPCAPIKIQKDKFSQMPTPAFAYENLQQVHPVFRSYLRTFGSQHTKWNSLIESTLLYGIHCLSNNYTLQALSVQDIQQIASKKTVLSNLLCK